MAKERRTKIETAVTTGLVSVIIATFLYQAAESKYYTNESEIQAGFPGSRLDPNGFLDTTCEVIPQIEQKHEQIARLEDDHGFVAPSPEAQNVKFELSLEERFQMAMCFDEWYERIPPVLGVEITQEYMEQMIDDLVPRFQTEGFIEEAIYPTDFSLFNYLDAEQNRASLGSSNCFWIRINDRIVNPFSTESTRDKLSVFTSTLTHELGHVQEKFVCTQLRSGNREVVLSIESTAQLMMLEVLAGLALEGNQIAAKALLHELRELMAYSAGLVAVREDRMDEYEEFRAMLDNNSALGALERDKFEREVGMENITFGIEVYSETPLIKFFDSFSNEMVIMDLAMYPTDVSGSLYRTGRIEWSGQGLFDDLAIFLKNGETISKAFAQNDPYNSKTS